MSVSDWTMFIIKYTLCQTHLAGVRVALTRGAVVAVHYVAIGTVSVADWGTFWSGEKQFAVLRSCYQIQ